MMTETRTYSTGLSMEAIPSGRAMPGWLVDALLQGRRLMVIHPSEECRRQAIRILHSRGGGKAIDTTHHLTIKRLIGILHLDLRLPALMDDDGILFEKTHRALADLATNYGFPLLQPNPQHRWSRSRSRRLLSLYSELITLRRPWDWEEDPGAKSCDKVLRNLESEMHATHPYRLERAVWESLDKSVQAPFTISDIEGIIMLDHPSGMSEIDLAILTKVASFIGLHQLVNPGSHRLGFHGEYVEDIAPCRTDESLPNWVPAHEVWVPETSIGWATNIGEERQRIIHHLMCELNATTHLALADILPKLEGDILVVSGDADSLRESLKPHLHSMGHSLATPSSKVSDSSAVARIISMANLSRGEEAWSLTRLNEMWSQIELPMAWPILDLQHPSEQTWQPKLHANILSEIARGFHLLGGRGALRRWSSVLSQASPRAGVNPEQRRQELEECQWWLACISHWMTPILPSEDQEITSQPVIGCSSGEELPLPQPPSDVVGWINSCLEQIDWVEFTSRDSVPSNSLPGLQYLMAAFSSLAKDKIEIDSDDFCELLSMLATTTDIPGIRNSDQGIKILTPSQAFGLESDNLILCGIDADAWSMRPSQIPWLDDGSRMKLGLHRPDEPLRQGRHQLRHLLNCATTIVLIDSSIEEGVELSGPLDEWFSEISQSGGVATLDQPPSFMNPDSWHPDTADRAWEWKVLGGESRLVYRVNSMEAVDTRVRTHRSGNLNRDKIQRSGLAIIESRRPNLPPLYDKSIVSAAEVEILSDQLSRRRTGDNLQQGEVFTFDQANNLIQTSDLKLSPTTRSPANGRESPVWPHLGKMGKKDTTLPIDPRPILPPSTGIEDLDSLTGRSQNKLTLPSVWSQGRLQSWLDCPRRAWYERHMYLGRGDGLREDLAATTRGDLVHLVEEKVLQAHGLESTQIPENPLPLHLGKLKDVDAAWQVVLQTLSEYAPWMKREDGISAHRCRDLVGVSPSDWSEWLETDIPIPIGGRLGRMLQCDFSLEDVAPIATEWELAGSEGRKVRLGLPDDDTTFLLRGRIDRVDELLLKTEDMPTESDKIIPLDFDLDSPPNAKRLVIIRDIKSIDGTKDDGGNDRHLKGIFQELQLALYARAWEVANPGDRVVGVGATQVGIETQAHVEIDPEFSEHCSQLQIGKISEQTHNHYRLPGNEPETSSNPFRAWMRERITTAIRVIENAKSGNIHPEPSNACKFCSIIDACPSAKRGGW